MLPTRIDKSPCFEQKKIPTGSKNPFDLCFRWKFEFFPAGGKFLLGGAHDFAESSGGGTMPPALNFTTAMIQEMSIYALFHKIVYLYFSISYAYNRFQNKIHPLPQ